MGNDGGSIPKRRELLRLTDSDSQTDNRSKSSIKLDAWYYCSISKEPLRYSDGKILSDFKGRLYNKESVLNHLLSKSKSPVHIKSLKDLVELKVRFKNDRISCPINGDIVLDLNGKSELPAFVYLVPCGCVISEKIIKEVTKLKSKPLLCPACNQPFESTHVIPINPNSTTDLESRMAALQREGRSHNLSRRHKKSRTYEESGASEPPKKKIVKAERGTQEICSTE